MGIQDIPPTYAAFDQFNREFEAEHFAYAFSNQRVADATRHLLLSWFPTFTRPVVNWGLPCLLDPPLLKALGWTPTPVAVQQLAQTVLKARSQFLRRLPPRTEPGFFVDQPLRSYADGYSLEDVGPEALRDRL